MSYLQRTFKGDFIHDALHKCGFSLAVLAHKCHFLATLYGESHTREHQVAAIALCHIFSNHRIVARTRCGRKFQVDVRIIHLIYLNSLYLFKLFDAALHLHRLRSLVAESLYELFSVLNLLLLVHVGTHLLLYTLLAQLHKLGVVHIIVINLATRNLNGSRGHIVDKSAVVTHQNHSIRLGLEEIFKPLYRLNIEVVGRLVEQQHIGLAQQ